ncbi:MAG: DsrE family protein [Nitrospirota bacterium]|nr:DsrE family protein [Nitrospirota bacterium]MDE3118176.1 DsrE family protein [Nitrospirota bacterium]MDE3225006.1 DsrE family protein [Nitrospirota bacterium]MDE3241407.1 DsrE family protein [Nitrospirota bacterium]
MKKLAVIVTGGSYNNLLQVCELVRIAAASGAQVSVLFRDEAASKLTHDKVKQLTFSDAYKGRESRVRDLLRERKRHDVPAVLREVKEAGDVKLAICRDTLEYFEIGVEQLLPELDEVQKAEAFWKEAVAPADQVLTF